MQTRTRTPACSPIGPQHGRPGHRHVQRQLERRRAIPPRPTTNCEIATGTRNTARPRGEREHLGRGAEPELDARRHHAPSCSCMTYRRATPHASPHGAEIWQGGGNTGGVGRDYRCTTRREIHRTLWQDRCRSHREKDENVKSHVFDNVRMGQARFGDESSRDDDAMTRPRYSDNGCLYDISFGNEVLHRACSTLATIGG